MKTKYGECHCGCGEKTNIATRCDTRKGWVKGEPKRFILGHHGRRSPLEYIIDSNGCWIWQRGRHPRGYGGIWTNGKWERAHRVYYEKYVGKIPNGMQIDHLCCVKECVNPEHLEVVTNAENSRRRGSNKINMEIAMQIRKETGTHKDIAKKYKLSQQHISDIVNNRRWA